MAVGNAGGIRAGMAYVELMLKDNAFNRGIDMAAAKLRSFGAAISGFGKQLATVGVVAMVSNPAGWVVGVMMFVGAAVGATGASSTFDYFWPEREH